MDVSMARQQPFMNFPRFRFCDFCHTFRSPFLNAEEKEEGEASDTGKNVKLIVYNFSWSRNSDETLACFASRKEQHSSPIPTRFLVSAEEEDWKAFS